MSVQEATAEKSAPAGTTNGAPTPPNGLDATHSNGTGSASAMNGASAGTVQTSAAPDTAAPAAPPPASPGGAAAASPGAPAVAPAATPAAKPRRNVRRIALPVLGLLLAGGLLYGANSYRESLLYVSTENAQLTGQPVQVGPTSAGRVSTINATIGASVHKGDLLAQIALPSQVGTSQNGSPKTEFLGAADTRIDVAAPIDGVVIAVPAAVGSTVAPGQPVVTLVDPTQLWVNANVEETKISRVKVGQPVDVHVDALNTTVMGRVEAITPATSAVFSLLPSNSSSGNFTKVTQLVPVRIAVNLGNQPSLLGSSVEVKVHVR